MYLYDYLRLAASHEWRGTSSRTLARDEFGEVAVAVQECL